MPTAALEASATRSIVAALAWTMLGAVCFQALPPDGSAGWVLASAWAVAGLWMSWLAQRPESRARWSLCCDEPGTLVSAVAMGWMMGTLWWHAQSCAGALSAPGWVAVHAAGMALAGTVVRPWSQVWTAAQRRTAVWLAALGVLALLAESAWAPAQSGLEPWRGLMAMALVTGAWAVEPASARRQGPRWLLAGLGPLGLWFIHQAWLSQGPEALWRALQVWAVAVLVLAAWRGWRAWRVRQSVKQLRCVGETA